MRKIYRSQDDKPLNPKELYSAFVKKYTYFKPYTQQDAHEFMRFLLEGLKEEVPPLPTVGTPDSVTRPTMKRTRRRTLMAAGIDDAETQPTNSSDSPGTYIDQLFFGKLASYVVCDTCKSVVSLELVLI
jgi:ubiquitin carboxyl-terminal hydrolase 16/45